MNEIITPFAYSDLSVTEAAELQAVTARIKDRLVRQVSDIIETGRDLLDVKSKLQHGQFESWLNLSFNMTMRTSQKYMRAAEWIADKSELNSHLTPNTIYLLSAPSTPEGVHEQVVERIEKGLPADPEYVRHVVLDAKIREREAKKSKEKRETRTEREQRKARLERVRREREDELQRIRTAAMGIAREVADILINKLSDEEIDKFEEALIDLDVTFMILREAIIDARQSHNDNSTVLPPKSWESKS